MDFQEKLEAYEDKIAQQNGVVTESVDQPTDVVPEEEIVEQAPVAEPTETKSADNTIPEVVQPDYNKFLEESSEGLFKTVDDFKTSFDKVRNYDAILQEAEDLKKNKVTFANERVQKYNELVADGKTEEQIDSWFKLQKIDLDQIDPFDAKVQRLVWDGYKKEVAERKVTREFGLDIDTTSEYLTEDEIESNKIKLEDAKEDLRIASKQDLQYLHNLKVQLSETKSAEEKQLDYKISQQQLAEQVKPLAKEMASSFNGVGDIILMQEDGKEPIKLSILPDESFKKEMEASITEHFIRNGIPIDGNNAEITKDIYRGKWLLDNLQSKIIPSVVEQIKATVTEQVERKYDNPSGLKVSGLAPVSQDAGKELREQMKRLARGED